MLNVERLGLLEHCNRILLISEILAFPQLKSEIAALLTLLSFTI